MAVKDVGKIKAALKNKVLLKSVGMKYIKQEVLGRNNMPTFPT
jgi:hypothetical protein